MVARSPKSRFILGINWGNNWWNYIIFQQSVSEQGCLFSAAVCRLDLSRLQARGLHKCFRNLVRNHHPEVLKLSELFLFGLCELF